MMKCDKCKTEVQDFWFLGQLKQRSTMRKLKEFTFFLCNPCYESFVEWLSKTSS